MMSVMIVEKIPMLRHGPSFKILKSLFIFVIGSRLHDIKECKLNVDSWSLLPASPQPRYPICCGSQFISHFINYND